MLEPRLSVAWVPQKMTPDVGTHNRQVRLVGTRDDRPAVLKNFPKQRQALPAAYSAIYEKHYKENRDGSTSASRLAQILEMWMHKQVAAHKETKSTGMRTLELGAGTLNHLKYESPNSSYDIVEPFTALFRSSSALPRIRNVYADVSEIPESCTYERIISIATLEHVCDLPTLVAKSALHLEPNGEFAAAIPSEGTWLWKLGWNLTTGLEFRRRYGLDYSVIMQHEHVNTAAEIESVLRYFFDNVQSKVFGLTKAISLYQYFNCKAPSFDKLHDYLTGVRD